jgi:hypothetical protein
MDASERARKAANARKNAGNTNTSSTSNNSGYGQTSGSKTIDLPKINDGSFDKNNELNPRIASNINFDGSSRTVGVSLPNLPTLTVDGISGLLKTTELKTISDVKNPGISEDEKCDRKTFERAKNDYEDGIRYLQLVQWANAYTGEQFRVIASQAKAYGQGLLAASEIEKVYQQFLELEKQKQITIEKGVNYVSQSHKTATVQASLPYTLAENESNLEQKRIKAKRSFEEAKQADIQLDDWLNSLNGNKERERVN